jgi:hypothetical protein
VRVTRVRLGKVSPMAAAQSPRIRAPHSCGALLAQAGRVKGYKIILQ